MMKSIKHVSLLFLLFGLFISSFSLFPATQLHVNDQTAIELMTKVDDLNDVYAMESDYALVFQDVSRHGIATFQTTPRSNLDWLLENGFVYNETSHVTRPPWERTTEDPYLKDQYALKMMQTPEAWTITEGIAGVKVAIIDTGIDINHTEFKGRIHPSSYNAVSEQVGINAVIDDHGHGTMVAGIIGAIKDNSVGIAGIAQNVSLLVIKANKPNEGSFQDASLVNGIYYAVEQGADIINLSLGGTYLNPLTKAALEYAYAQGVVVVAAAGNDGTDTKFYPAAFDTTLSISSVNKNKVLSDFSNYGSTIDLSAPGEQIMTTVRNNGYGTASGTSFASPQVAGVLALMLSHDHTLTRPELEARLRLSSMDEGEEGYDVYFGHGIVNTYQALTYDTVLISFETFGGSAIEPIYALANEPFDLPQNPSLKDHVFDGWYLDDSLSTPLVLPFVPTEDTTLFAKFNAAFHTVYFHTEGSAVDAMVVEHGGSFDLPTSFLGGHHFIGWTLDDANTIPYYPSFVWADVHLYAHFEPFVYHDVTLILDGFLYDTLSILFGEILSLDALSKTGHHFSGWHEDEALSIPYFPKTIDHDFTLYAAFIPHIYTLSFVTEGFAIDPLSVPYGDIPSLPDASHPSKFFVGWFIDASLTTPYEDTQMTANLTLYAAFCDDAYLVEFMDGDILLKSLYVTTGDPLPQFIPTKTGYTFVGWYEDQTLHVAYDDLSVDTSLTLYAKFALDIYTVIFYDADLVTVLSETMVSLGQSVTPPEAPIKNSSPTFIYTFSHWSESTDYITSDLAVYPIYERIFKPESVYLNPGIDTIEQGNLWHDAGLHTLDERLEITRENAPDIHVLGRYLITYKIMFEGDILALRYRVVRVIEPTPINDIRLNEGISTLPKGTPYEENGATSNQGEIEIISDVDIHVPGTYHIIYRLTYNGNTFERTRKVHILESEPNNEVAFIAYLKKEDDRDVV